MSLLPMDPIGIARCIDCGTPLTGRAIGTFPRGVRGNRCDACHVDWLNVEERKRSDEYWALYDRQEAE